MYTYSKEEVFSRVSDVLVNTFEIERESIALDARLGDDLDIDSIDAIDLLAELKDYIGRKVEPEDFNEVTTLGDVVDVIERMACN